MGLSNLLHRARRKTFARAATMAGWDNLALRRIQRRRDLERIGNRNGGWTVPVAELGSSSICYCVGCGEDISFDLELIRRFGCAVFAFDPTPRAIDYVRTAAGDNSQYHFSPVGLWDQDDTLRFFAPKDPTHVSHSLLNLQKTDTYIRVPVRRLSHLMRDLGHGRLDLLKLDIEGAEYKVIETVLEDRLPIRVLCVEFDEYFNPLDAGATDRVREAIARLIAAGYAMVHCEGNGNYTFVQRG